ncbi:hypothetical protein MKW94_026578 [Papaver nudicaule]|uniref:Uncharacterized protein n=1 Tax=Papaver nudicaule TaxID=74823 RepID=A0AA41S5L9_PAPNU|nr:hypothetical protein [Papaver nudicaule]
MSWYTDPQLFINFYCQNPSQFYWVDRIAKKYDVPLSRGDISCTEELDFCKHLSLGYNKESDYDAFKSSLAEFAYPISKLVNCQGLVVHWDNNKQSGTWSRVEEHDSIFYCLPGIKKPSGWAERLALEERISKLVAEMSLVKDEVTNLQEQLNLEKNDKQALQEKLNQEKNDRQALQEQLNQERNDRQAQFSYLTAKLEECRRGAVGCGSCNVEPWMRGCCVPSHWVPFEELDVQNVPRDVPLIITEAPATWSRVEEHDSIFYSLFYSLPGIKKPCAWAQRLALEERISKLVAEMSLVEEKLNNKVTNLQEQLNQEKNDRQALEEQLNQEKNDRQALQEQLDQEKNDRQAQVSDLTAKLGECRGAAGCGSCNVEPWMRGCSVPSSWVPFEELDVQTIPLDIPLTITEATGSSEFGEDTTTNVQATHFCRGKFPIVVLNILDLVPNNGKARFDPDIWCSLSSAGNCYAARKPSESEMMSFDPPMRG